MNQIDRNNSRLALGTAQFGGLYGIANVSRQVDKSDAKEILSIALGNNINLIDTAMLYGECDHILGSVGITEFKVVTKLPEVSTAGAPIDRWVYDKICQHLAILGVDSVYGILLHRPDQLLGPYGSEIYRAIQYIREIGLAKKIGISIYDPAVLGEILPKYQLDLIQAPFNIFDQRLSSSGWLQRLKDDATEVHVRSIFLQGLLLMPRHRLPKYFSSWANLWDEWYDWVNTSKYDPIQTCLQFPLSFPEIDRIVVGVDTVVQLKEILASLERVKIITEQEFPEFGSLDKELIDPGMWVSG